MTIVKHEDGSVNLRFQWVKPTTKWRNAQTHTKRAIREWLGNRDGWHCHYCNTRIVGDQEARQYAHDNGDDSFSIILPEGVRTAQVDHKTPECKGGNSEPDNLVLACVECNTRKGARDYYDFLLRLESEEFEVAA